MVRPTRPNSPSANRAAFSQFWKAAEYSSAPDLTGTPGRSCPSFQFSSGRAYEAIVCQSRTGGTCQGIPPLRREPYAGLRRVSHEQRPERSRRRGRRTLGRRLWAGAGHRGARRCHGAGGRTQQMRSCISPGWPLWLT